MSTKNYNENELENEHLIIKKSHRIDYMARLEDRYEQFNKANHNINAMSILYFICDLQNWGLYKRYEPIQFNSWFQYNQKDFYERLKEYANNNKQAIKDAIQVCMFQVRQSNSLNKNFYYSEFLDDLYSILGFTIKPKIYNFFTPSAYSKEGQQNGAMVFYQVERMMTDFEYREKVFKSISERIAI